MGRRENIKLSGTCQELGKKLEHAQANFREAVNRRNWLSQQKNLSGDFEAEIQDLTNLLELMLEEKSALQAALESQVAGIRENHEGLVRLMRKRSFAGVTRALVAAERGREEDLLRMVWYAWALPVKLGF